MRHNATEHSKSAPAICFSSRDERENERARVCSRLLLYLHGLNVRALSRLEIAGESLRRAGPDTGLAEAMREMHAILREHGLECRAPLGASAELPSFPALERRPMLAGSIEGISLNGLLGRRAARPAGGAAAAG